MPAVVLSIGSNLGERFAALQSVIDAMRARFTLIETSRVFETSPWGEVQQPPFLNAAVRAETDLTPTEVLEFARACEEAAGRTREVRWGPRTLDVDVIAYDALASDDPELTLPHPRAHERRFVLACLADIDPAMEIGGHGDVATLLASLPDEGVVARPDLQLVVR